MNVLGIGTDITECLRIAQMIERHGELFVGRVYTPLEIEYCRSRRMATQHFTGRWAAKEAVLKALGHRLEAGHLLAGRGDPQPPRRPAPGLPLRGHAGGGRVARDPLRAGEHLPLPLPRHGLRRRPRRGAGDGLMACIRGAGLGPAGVRVGILKADREADPRRRCRSDPPLKKHAQGSAAGRGAGRTGRWISEYLSSPGTNGLL